MECEGSLRKTHNAASVDAQAGSAPYALTCYLGGLTRKARKAAGINCGSRQSSFRIAMKDADLLIDMTRLRVDFERAMAQLCGCE